MERQKPAKMSFSERSREKRAGLTCIDLFSGAGGLAEGFRQAGWSILSANDLDSYAAATFRLNFSEASFFEGPISSLNPKDLLKDAGIKRGELDCLIGGPPCQSFSYNNHQRSARDVRSKLFRCYLRIVKALNPKTLVMENVPGMLTISNGRVIQEIRRELGKLGYNCTVRILHSEDYGVPQKRRRAFVLASRVGASVQLLPIRTHGLSQNPKSTSNPLVYRGTPTAGQQVKALVTVWDAIGDLPVIRSGGGKRTSKYSKKASTEFQKKIRKRSQVLRDHVCHALTAEMLKRIVHVGQGGNWRDIPRRLLPAGMKRARKSDHTKRYGRLKKTALASTILTKCDPHWGAYIHPTQTRTISIREAARLQGFPDSFRFSGAFSTYHYIQIGNAVPVPMAEAVGTSVARHLKEWIERRPKKSVRAATTLKLTGLSASVSRARPFNGPISLAI